MFTKPSLVRLVFSALLLLSVSACSSTGRTAPLDDPSFIARSAESPEPTTVSSADSSQAPRAMLAVPGAPVSYAPQLTQAALLWYLPNRVLDLIDVFRFDVGVGVSYGAVLRLTKYAQVGYRDFAPYSFRLGPHGRWRPYFTEQYPEYGVAQGFVTNRQRRLTVTPAEFGVGADLLLVGGYFGLAFDELLDFVLGIALIDFQGDDL